MGLINSQTYEEKKYSTEELIEAAREMRALDLISIYAAGSGHPGGTLSIMDIAAALFLNEARLDPNNPKWEEREYTDENRPLGYKTHMSVTEFLKISDDCRSGFALMKVLLGKSVENVSKAMELLE